MVDPAGAGPCFVQTKWLAFWPKDLRNAPIKDSATQCAVDPVESC